jgi:hypothetical protein
MKNIRPRAVRLAPPCRTLHGLREMPSPHPLLRLTAPMLLALAACSSAGNTSANSDAMNAGGAEGTHGGSTFPASTANHAGSAVQSGNVTVGGSIGGNDKATSGDATSTASGASATPSQGNVGTVPVSSAADCRKEGDGKTTLVFANGCAEQVEFRGSDIAGGTLAPGASACVDIGTSTEALSSKRYWGWVGEDPGAERYTLAEFTFNTDFHDLDWYDISHVDAHNLPMAILPSARPQCRQLSCPQDFLATCPEVGQYRDSQGRLLSCVSPNRDDPTNPVVLLFEQCDDAYAWSGDDQKGTDVSPVVGCEVEDFDIVFCPEGK